MFTAKINKTLRTRESWQLHAGTPKTDLGQNIGWSISNGKGRWLGVPTTSTSCPITYQFYGYCRVLTSDNSWDRYSFTFNVTQWTTDVELYDGIRIIVTDAGGVGNDVMFDNITLEAFQEPGKIILKIVF